LAPNRAKEVLAAYPEVTDWAVGGHSLGGAMAASFVYNHPGLIDNLILWAAFPAESNSLAERSELAVTSIYGAQDGLATVAEIEASRVRLPVDTQFVPIEGGNHAQFGWYGPQAGDNPATISREEQQRAVVAATRTALEGL
jgi:pimeloyl-ACP methyl ester carboxylesterase